MGFLFIIFLSMGFLSTQIVNVDYVSKQILLDLAAMLTGNVTAVLNTTIQLMSDLAGIIFDIERILEKVIVMLAS